MLSAVEIWAADVLEKYCLDFLRIVTTTLPKLNTSDLLSLNSRAQHIRYHCALEIWHPRSSTKGYIFWLLRKCCKFEQSKPSVFSCPVEKCQNFLFCFLGPHQLTTQLHLPPGLLTPSLPTSYAKHQPRKNQPFPCLTFVWHASSNLPMLDVHDAKQICICLFEESCGAGQWAALQTCSTARSALFPSAAACHNLLQAPHCPPDSFWWIGHNRPKVRWGWKSRQWAGFMPLCRPKTCSDSAL